MECTCHTTRWRVSSLRTEVRRLFWWPEISPQRSRLWSRRRHGDAQTMKKPDRSSKEVHVRTTRVGVVAAVRLSHVLADVHRYALRCDESSRVQRSPESPHKLSLLARRAQKNTV